MKTIFLACILFLSGCHNINTNGLNQDLDKNTIERLAKTNDQKLIKPSRLEGTYYNNKVAHTNGKIKLFSDQTFILSKGGSHIQQYTEGKWKKKKDEVILTSSKKYVKYKGTNGSKIYHPKNSITNRSDFYLEDWRLKIGLNNLTDEKDTENPVYWKE